MAAHIRHIDRCAIFAVVLSALLLCVGRSGASAQDADSVARTANEYLTTRTAMGDFSGAVLIVRDGRILLRKGYGYADIEKLIPYTPETRHEVASISKMFTAAAVLKLRDSHKLELDDPVCRYLSSCPTAWKPILIRHLIGHTSGIPDYEGKLELGSAKYLEFMQRPDASRRIVEDAKLLPLDFAPGTQFNYSNTAYILLSVIVEKVGQMPFSDFVERELLRPAGMAHSGVIDSRHLPPHLARGYTHDDLGWEKTLSGVILTAGQMRRLPQLSLTSPEGDAFLYSTVDDLYRWSQVMDGERPSMLSLGDIREILTPNQFGYGFGWFVGKGFDETRYRHNGALPGYWSDFIKFPDRKVTIIIFANVPGKLSSIARDLSGMVLGKPFDMPVRGKVVAPPAESLARLEGRFRWPDGKLLTVTNKPGGLTAVLEGRFGAVLVPLSDTKFYFPLGDGTASFILGREGRAESVNIHYSGEDHVAVRIDQQ